MINLDSIIQNDWRPLHYSCKFGNVYLTNYFLNKKANPNVQNDKKETPLIIAVKSNNFQICESLVKN
jgi:ankyrin repeat protein